MVAPRDPHPPLTEAQLDELEKLGEDLRMATETMNADPSIQRQRKVLEAWNAAAEAAVNALPSLLAAAKRERRYEKALRMVTQDECDGAWGNVAAFLRALAATLEQEEA